MLAEHEEAGEGGEKNTQGSQKEIQIGMGYGDCIVCHVGGVFGRTAFFAAGDALTEAQDSLKLAKVHKGIIVSKALWKTYQNTAPDEASGLASQQDETGHNSSNIHSTKVHIQGYVKIENSEENFEAFEEEKKIMLKLPRRNKPTSFNQIKRAILKLTN